MPFIDERQVPQALSNFAPPDDPDIDPSMGETVGAAFRTQNVIGSYLSSRGAPDPYQIDDGFDAIDYVKDDAKYSPYVDEFAGIFNRKAADAKKLQIDREEQDRRTLDAAGGLGVIAQMAAGVVDLPTLLPVGGALVGAGRGALGSAIRIGIGSGIDAAVSEAALQGTQATRTGAESALNIGGSIILGGALGALAGRYLDGASQMAMSRKIEGQAKAFDDIDQGFIAAGNAAQSAGAAARDVGPLVLKDEALISKLPGINRQDPLIRLQLGQSDTGREVVRQMAETPLEYADNAAGVATEKGGSVETRMKMWNAPLAEGLREIDTNYARYFHNTPEPTGWQVRLSPLRSEFARKRGGDKMTYKEFKEEVGRAAYMDGKHEVPEVASAAQVYRRVDDQLKQAAIEARIPGFTDDMQMVGDVSHRFRMYNKQKIIADRGRFGDILHDYFRTQRDLAAKVEAVSGKVDAAANKAAKDAEEFGRLSDAELRDIVEQVTDKILGHADGRIPYDIVSGPRGALRERLLKIETAKIHDFVENDIEHVLHSQIRTMSADIELSKKFGSVDLAEQIRKVNDEANAKIANATTPKERQALEKSRKDTIRDIEGIRDRLRGQYALPDNPESLVVRTGRVARNINYLRLMGGMTISALPDMAKVVFTHGLTSTFRDGFLPMIRNFKAFRLAADEVKMAGTALDMVLDSRTMAMADIMDDFGRGSKFERGLKAASSKFGMVSLMAPWNAAMKQFAGMVTMTNIMRAAEAVSTGNATARQVRNLASSGIDEDLARRIWKEFNGGTKPANPRFDAQLPTRETIGTKVSYKGVDFEIDQAADYVSFRLGNLPEDLNHSMVYAEIKDGALRVNSVTIDKSLRGQGIGSKAYELAIEYAQSKGLRFESDTQITNAADRVYQSLSKRGYVFRKSEKAVQRDKKVDALDGWEGPEPIYTLEKAPAPPPETVDAPGHGTIQDGVYIPGGMNWTDRQALESFRAAVVRDVDRIVVTPGQDKPLWMSTELGKVVGQFKSFNVSTVQKTMLAGLQQRDAATLNGAMLALGLGALTYWAKQSLAGREVSDNPAVWATEALDWSGLIGWMSDVNNIAEKASRGRVGLAALTGEQVSRYASRNVTGAFLGPTADAVSDIFQVSGSIFAGDTTKSDLRKLRQMAPAQNLFYIRSLLNQVEEATGNALGLPDTRK